MYQLGTLPDSMPVNELVTTMHQTVARELCPQCNRPFGVSCTRVDSPMRVRYLACRKCKIRGQQPELVPLDVAPQQAGPGRPAAVGFGTD